MIVQSRTPRNTVERKKLICVLNGTGSKYPKTSVQNKCIIDNTTISTDFEQKNKSAITFNFSLLNGFIVASVSIATLVELY